MLPPLFCSIHWPFRWIEFDMCWSVYIYLPGPADLPECPLFMWLQEGKKEWKRVQFESALQFLDSLWLWNCYNEFGTLGQCCKLGQLSDHCRYSWTGLRVIGTLQLRTTWDNWLWWDWTRCFIYLHHCVAQCVFSSQCVCVCRNVKRQKHLTTLTLSLIVIDGHCIDVPSPLW